MAIDHPIFANRSSHPERLILWMAVCLGGGLAIGFLFQPDAWFQSLNRPWYAPPNWLFGPVWTALYLLMAYAMHRVEHDGFSHPVRIARRIFLTQLALNFLWTPVFFGAHLMWAAFGIITALLVAIGATILAFDRVDRTAALLMVPYGAWVTFAAFLNAGYAFLN
ncbi:Tryptophan-rich protein TspO [Usitatibacter rugosus]|uniref:Tryptophan-rich protein TspO n=1 Tax=Usitatibacter rugosus TaxID=2732067 RepID=A0A6M4H0F1_9PROT|nr:TspO/MBR family protein [Usitatibacter rugosus]QJR12976.1 Tryptophan-rich protein TspO [Usitatibacter rugosus]